jgi:hypothetical protein
VERGKLAKAIVIEDSIRVTASPSKTGGLMLRPTLMEE